MSRSRWGKLFRTPIQFFRDSRCGVWRGFGAVLARLAYGRDGACGWYEEFLPRWAAKWSRTRNTSRRAALLAKHNHPSVTVVMAARNAAETIGASVSSILKQTYTHIELLIVDDASTDATATIVKQLAEQDGRVRIESTSQQVGAARARNRAMQEATGEYLTFQDADDIAHPERIERQLGALLVESSAVLCLCSGRRVDAEGRAVRVNGRRDIKWVVSMMFPRDKVMSRVGFLQPLRISEDAEYYERIKLVFQGVPEIRILKTIYFARYSPRSLLFSDGDVCRDKDGNVQHTRSAQVERGLEEMRAVHDKIRRGEVDAYAPFV